MAKNPPANGGAPEDVGSIPGLGRCPGGGHGNPLVFLPGKSHGQRSLAGCGPWGHKEPDTTEQLSTHAHTYKIAGFLRVSLLPCILSFAYHNGILLSKLPKPKLRMSRHWAVSTSQSHEWTFPPPKEHISWVISPVTFGGPSQISSCRPSSSLICIRTISVLPLCLGLSVFLTLGAFFPVPSVFSVTSVSTGDKGWAWVHGGG